MAADDTSLFDERTTALAREILILMRENYLKGPHGRDRVYEALNALAFCAAITIKGADRDEALKWFSDALDLNLKD